MTFFEAWRPTETAAFDNARALHMQVGALSPLWFPIAGAAAAGLAVWSLTRWMRLAAPEGRVAAEPTPGPVAEPEPAVALAAPAQVEAAEAAPAKKAVAAVAAVARKPAARKPRPVAH